MLKVDETRAGMNTSQSSTTVFSYPAPRPARHWLLRRLAVVALSLVVLTPFVLLLDLAGARPIGFSYGVSVNNAATICPDTVVSQSGQTITLSDGRTFRVDLDADNLAWRLTDAENRVWVDEATGEVFGLSHIRYCGFSRPESRQWVTIALFKKELPSHTRKYITSVAKR
jgi:hypothetical protein